MKLNPPSEFKNYQYDQTSASRASLLTRIFGWLSLLSFATAMYAIIFLPNDKHLMLYWIGFMMLFSVYVILKILKRHFKCSQCQKVMDVIYVKWTPEEWQEIQKYELMESFKGADGNLYTTERESHRGGSTHYFIHAHSQRWYVCYECRLYFLNTEYLSERIFTTILKDEFEQTKHLLLTDVKAIEKMELAYKERLAGR
ncbi:hypothetical protein ACFLQ1_01805 [Candidatus Auribacterota bacterium]